MSTSREDLADRIRRFLEVMDIEQRALAQSVDMSESSLSRALTGSRAFKAIEVARIAEVLGVSVDRLLGSQDPGEPQLAARRNGAENAGLERALMRVQTFDEIQRMLPEIEPPVWPPFDVSGLEGTMWQQGEELANRARAALGESVLPQQLDDLAALIDRAFGVSVAIEPTPAGLDGLSCSHGALRLAFVSSSTPPVRQRWTLAHELGHLLAGDSQELRVDEHVFNNRAPDETRANAFAAAFLMPADAVRSDWQQANEGGVGELLEKYRVSQQALAYRLHNVGAVGASGRDWILRSPVAHEDSIRASTLSARSAQLFPQRMSIRVVEAYSKGELGVRPLAAYLDMSVDEVLRRLSPDEQEAEVLGSETSDAAVS